MALKDTIWKWTRRVIYINITLYIVNLLRKIVFNSYILQEEFTNQIYSTDKGAMAFIKQSWDGKCAVFAKNCGDYKKTTKNYTFKIGVIIELSILDVNGAYIMKIDDIDTDINIKLSNEFPGYVNSIYYIKNQ